MASHREAKPRKFAPVWAQTPPELRVIAPPRRLLVPLSGGESTEARIKPPGSRVRRGEPLVDLAPASAHTPIAPADGVLGSAGPATLTSGRPTRAVELLVDRGEASSSSGSSESSPFAGIGSAVSRAFASSDDPVELVAWLDRLRHAGVTADRHSSPDLIGQLNQIVSRPVDTVICTVLDADASLRLSAALAARNAEAVVAGVELLARMTAAERVVVAVEAYAALTWATPLRAAVRAAEMEIIELENDYPQADPTLMIYTLTRRRLKPGNLPATQGALMLDAAAALAVGRAARGEPALTTPLAVHDHIRRQSHLLSVSIGTPVAQLLEELGIAWDHRVVRGGDLLRDVRLTRDAVIGGAELTLHITLPDLEINPEPCIRCGWCLEACPTLVQPAGVLEAAQRHDNHMAGQSGISACIECGVCSHVCPSRLPILPAIREMKARLARGDDSRDWVR